MAELSHFDDRGASRMVDVGQKPESERTARASSRVVLAANTAALIRDKSLAKGDVLEVARLAGIMAAKKTAELIPLCHPLPLTSVALDLSFDGDDLVINATVTTIARTGVEMEALTAASIAALTVYDMVKSVERGVTITDVHLEEKTGGVRGSYQRPD
jgi:cyclic pyranopterin phosphate synthase